MNKTIIPVTLFVTSLLLLTSCGGNGPEKGFNLRKEESKSWLISEGLTGNEVTYSSAQWALWKDVPDFGDAYFYKAKYTLNLSKPQTYYEVFCWIVGDSKTMDITESEWQDAFYSADETGTI